MQVSRLLEEVPYFWNPAKQFSTVGAPVVCRVLLLYSVAVYEEEGD